MKILIIGGGSIGQRHLRNLKKIGIKEIGVVEINKKKIEDIAEKYRVETYKELKNALKEKWDAIFICTPPATHTKIAIIAIKKETPIFIEKPLSNNLRNIKFLIKTIKINKVPAMVGYNLNFHPQLREIKKILKKKLLGKIWGTRAEFGQYLPDWHPWEDYRSGYSAQKRLGGGIILDDIHEIDYLYHLFGKIKKISALAEKISNLKIDTEDYAELTLWFKNGILGEIHMDYLQRIPVRNLKIIGEKGTLIWDIRESELRYFLIKNKKWHSKKIKNFDFNQTYLKEIKYFLSCIRNHTKPQPDLNRGYEALKIALAAKKSAKLQKAINL